MSIRSFRARTNADHHPITHWRITDQTTGTISKSETLVSEFGDIAKKAPETGTSA